MGMVVRKHQGIFLLQIFSLDRRILQTEVILQEIFYKNGIKSVLAQYFS